MSRRFHIFEWWLSGKSTIPEQTKIAVDYLDIPWFIVRISKFPQTYQQISSKKSVAAQSTGTNLNWQTIARPWQTAAVRGRATRWHLWTLWGLGSSLTSGQGRLGASVSGAFFVKCWIVWWMGPLRFMICFIHVKNTFGVMNQLITGWPLPVIVAAWYSFF